MGFGSGASEYIALQLHAVDDRADSALPGSSYWHFDTGVPSGSSQFGCQDGERARARRKIHGPRAPERDRSVWACADRVKNPRPVSVCKKYHRSEERRVGKESRSRWGRGEGTQKVENSRGGVERRSR